ncbi:hypothetical protein EVAR_1038_1 [Eumeta japonica]|uniref:Reverse transcriptase domain-containing protein n=1 Tax=Eumeta variegata TaxID=151549 RepID=A0A4C1S9E7_EUMVA|nr:hypothetical protein EVAR_1038_1 [Eumeta japonica]
MSTPLDSVAELADRIKISYHTTQGVYFIFITRQPRHYFDILNKQVAAPTRKLEECAWKYANHVYIDRLHVYISVKTRSYSRPEEYPYCWYHHRFGSADSAHNSVHLIGKRQQQPLAIPVHTEDIPKTATTPFGLYEFPYMTFGLRNATHTFQRFIDEVLRGLDFYYSFIDDILVFSKTHIEHEKHLRCLFQRVKEYGILVNTSKCTFGQKEIDFLGHRVTDGIKLLDMKAKAVQKYPPPKTIKELRRFLGIINFSRRFIPAAAEYQASLNSLLAGAKAKCLQPIQLTPKILPHHCRQIHTLAGGISSGDNGKLVQPNSYLDGGKIRLS